MFCEFCKCEGQEEEDKKEGKSKIGDKAREGLETVPMQIKPLKSTSVLMSFQQLFLLL